jgi:uncharacterized protein YqfB (UPF0267 family)
MDYVNQWYDEIAEQWVVDFVLMDRIFEEVSVEVTDPNGDVDEDSDDFEVKNVIFTIEVNGKSVNLWVFYDMLSEEVADVENLNLQEIDETEVAKSIHDINERWKKIKASKYPESD